ncbi:hypothetical protein NL676_014378 [Syzygium grande]|nr:hypothetical protein NL676_014378 [Syzygium grande]
MYQDGTEETGPLRSFEPPHDGVGEWNPSAIKPPDGKIVDPEEPIKKPPIVPPGESLAAPPLQVIPPEHESEDSEDGRVEDDP